MARISRRTMSESSGRRARPSGAWRCEPILADDDDADLRVGDRCSDGLAPHVAAAQMRDIAEATLAAEVVRELGLQASRHPALVLARLGDEDVGDIL